MGDEYPCPHCGAMNRERTDYLRITCRVCGGQYEARHLVSTSSIAELAKQVSEERHAREQVNPAMGLEFVNTARWEPLGHAYTMSLRLTELHLAICTVEECGASPELTEAVNREPKRRQVEQRFDFVWRLEVLEETPHKRWGERERYAGEEARGQEM